ncbi:MAG: gephyrin-like molybdotransferase Glp [Myxococcota bacterium]
MKSIGEALRSMLPAFEPLGSESLAVDSALDRHLAEDVPARVDAPPFDNSAMDGYAVRTGQTTEGAKSKVVGESRAGGGTPAPLAEDAVMRIFTGAVMPEGADAVVIQEDVDRDGEQIWFRKGASPRANIRFRGSDSKAGETLLGQGLRVGPGEIGLLVSQGIATVDVFRQPSVAIMTTGDELRELGEALDEGTIYNSNAHALAAQVRAAGCRPVVFPIVGDSEHELRGSLARALRHDVVLTSGGVSVGEHDHVRDAFESSGVKADFWKVAVKPGKPLSFGVGPGGRPVVGLPGNPISSMVTFEAFVRPCLRKMLGDPRPFRPPQSVRLTHPHRHSPRRPELARGKLTHGPDGWELTLHRLQGSGSLPSMVDVDALVLLPAGEAEFEPGRRLQAILLRDETGHIHPPFEA